MKKLLLYLSVLLSFNGFSQNWSLLNLNTEANYSLNNSTVVTNVISIDSVKVQNSDSIFYLNRIMTNCDTCANNAYKLKNQPQFLMRQVVKTNSNSYIFKDPSEFLIKPKETLSASWVFDTTNNVIATIDSIYIDSIFGQTDSVKRISLNDGGTINISKKYGILHFSRNNSIYTLTGINGQQPLGKQVPSFLDFYDYNVNDILQWQEYNVCSGPGGSSTKKHYHASIVSKQIDGDTLTYQLSGNSVYFETYKAGQYYKTDTVYGVVNKTLQFINSAHHLANAYPKKVHDNNLPSTLPYTYRNFAPTEITYVGGKAKKEINLLEDYFSPTSSTNPDVLAPTNAGYPANRIQTLFTEELGHCTFERYVTCEVNYCMRGRLHNGDTIGELRSESFYAVGLKELEIEELKIHPNPTSNILNIEIDEFAIDKVEVLSMSGKLLKSTTVNINSIDISNLPNGVYFLKIYTDDHLYLNKVVKN